MSIRTMLVGFGLRSQKEEPVMGPVLSKPVKEIEKDLTKYLMDAPTINQKEARKEKAKQLLELRQYRNAMYEAYNGGLKAEQMALNAIKLNVQQKKNKILAKGRRIDLLALLQQSNKEGKPVWCFADPTQSLGFENGACAAHGCCQISNANSVPPSNYWTTIRINRQNQNNLYPQGEMPPLPDKVRSLATSQKIRNAADFVGVLFQPEGWMEVKPADPALIVKWKGVDGYYALAIWGGDRAAIMEFVD